MEPERPESLSARAWDVQLQWTVAQLVTLAPTPGATPSGHGAGGFQVPILAHLRASACVPACRVLLFLHPGFFSSLLLGPFLFSPSAPASPCSASCRRVTRCPQPSSHAARQPAVSAETPKRRGRDDTRRQDRQASCKPLREETVGSVSTDPAASLMGARLQRCGWCEIEGRHQRFWDALSCAALGDACCASRRLSV